MKRIDILQRKLRHLAKFDRRRKVFGADGHKYKTKPLSKKKLGELERALGTVLPDELRQWLLIVGQGAGPGYGLFPTPDCCDPELDVSDEISGDYACFWDISADDLTARINTAWATEEEKDGNRGGSEPFTTLAEIGGAGFLFLADAGCSHSYIMPLRGSFAGRIFFRTTEPYLVTPDGEVEYGGVVWLEGIYRTSTHPKLNSCKYSLVENAAGVFSFLDWIEDWLDTETKLIENYDIYEAEQAELFADIRREFGHGLQSLPRLHIGLKLNRLFHRTIGRLFMFKD